MRKIKHILFFSIAFIIMLSLNFQSCQNFKEFIEDSTKFEHETFELDNLSDSMWIKGSFAAPIINTRIKLSTIIPDSNDSTIWAQVDPDGFIHLRSYYKHEVSTGTNFYHGIIPAAGNVVLKDSVTYTSTKRDLKFYSNSILGHVYFADPKVTLIFHNEMPIEFGFRINAVTLYDKDTLPISQTPNSVLHTIDAAYAAGKPRTTSVVYTKNEIPALVEIFSPIPKFVSFTTTIGSFKTQIIPYSITGNEKIFMDFDLDFPLNLRLNEYTLSDTIDFPSLEQYQDKNQTTLKSIELRLEFNNGLPIALTSNIIFTDSLGKFIHKLDLINFDAAPVNATTGRVTSSVKKRTSIILDQVLVQKLIDQKATKIVYKFTCNTTNWAANQNVKIYSSDFLGLKIGIKIDYEGPIIDTFSKN